MHTFSFCDTASMALLIIFYTLLQSVPTELAFYYINFPPDLNDRISEIKQRENLCKKILDYTPAQLDITALIQEG